MLETMSTPDRRPTVAQRLLADSTVFQWQNQTLGADLIFTLPIAVCLAIGLAIGHPGVGLLVAGGAANTGFGQKHRIDDSHLVPMIFVTLGMAFSGFVGVLLGHENLGLVLCAALWAFGYGMLTARPEGYAWVGLQCVITFLVASAFPASVKMAALRGLLLLAGGAVQLIISSLLLRRFHKLRDHLFELAFYVREERAALVAALSETAQSVRERRYLNSALPYALRLGLTVGLATEIYRRMHYPSGYWIPMTALLVLKPGLTDTVSRALARVLGTMCGAAAISFLLAHVNPSQLALAASVKPADLSRMVDAYQVFKPQRLVFTKLDETASFGPIFNEAVRTAMPLSFFATGQRIPEDLEEVTPVRLTSLILSGQGLRSRAVA